MRHRVLGKQPNSRMCLVCGLKNPLGLKASFFELDNGELMALFRPLKEHQSYPGRLHGGIAAAILDETIGRAIMIPHDDEIWGVTVEFTTRYRKPVPLEEEIRVIGRIGKRRKGSSRAPVKSFSGTAPSRWRGGGDISNTRSRESLTST